MNISTFLRSLSVGLLAALCGCSSPSESTTEGGGGSSSSSDSGGGSTSTDTSTVTVTAPPDGDATYAAVTAAEAFLATLDESQRVAVAFSFSDGTQRTNWSNFPTGLYDRSGVSLGEMTSAQETALFALLAALLSSAGYDQVVATVNADEALKAATSGGNLVFGRDEYYVSILGTPSATTPWMVQFGGHHLAINVTIVGGDMTLAPSLTGAQPTSFVLDGATIRPQGEELDAAFDLIGSLSTEQQSKAVIAAAYMDLSLGPGQDGVVLASEGIVATDLDAGQQAALIDLIGLRVGMINDEDAAIRMADIEANLDQTYFAWAGPTAAGSAAYYRITGPTLAIEYAPQSMGGDATDHTHAMYRDPINDYGAALVE